MVGFIIGLFVGGIFGVFIMALMQVASDEDKRAEHHRGKVQPYSRNV